MTDDHPEDRIRTNMRAVRETLGLSQAQVAALIDVDTRTYRRWESGETYGFLYKLRAIARALETTEQELLGDAQIEDVVPPRQALLDKIDELTDEVRRMRADMDELKRGPK